MNIVSIIMTHKEALPTVETHFPIWDNIGSKIIFVSPGNSLMNIGGEIGIGEAEHHGEISAQRIIKIFEFALKLDWTHLLLMEYDSFALSIPEDVMPGEGGVSAALYNQNKIGKYKGKFYLHYPMLFTREGFQKTYLALSKVTTRDRYFSDRFIGRAVEFAKVPVNDLIGKKRAFSKNTILPDHYSKLRDEVKAGALFFHGVKTLETLNQITEISKQ